MTLQWNEDGWKVAEFEQKGGPELTTEEVQFGTAPAAVGVSFEFCLLQNAVRPGGMWWK
uniref:hypothetical protein n=1 Tax=Streptomyces chartreusis TaxID=1969 RepID=UPI003F4965A0